MEGKIYNQANGMPYFGITKDGQAVIRTDSDLSDLETAVGGDAILINNGVPIDASSSYGELKSVPPVKRVVRTGAISPRY